MKLRKKAYASILVLLLIGLVLVASVPPARAQFVIASWDYPDEYGQGIEAFEIFENSTGAWVQFGGAFGQDDNMNFEWNASAAIKLKWYTWLNSTLTGASDTTDGKNYQQHNVTVVHLGETIFSQQNFTWFHDDDSIDPPMWYYGYEVILNFIPADGQIYTVTVTYEIFY